MTKRTKLIAASLTGVVLLLVVLGTIGNGDTQEVRVETVDTRDITASVSASGKVQPNNKVDISADISGRVTRLAVKEGDSVVKGQFLLEIDPSQYQADVDRARASVASSQAQVSQARAAFRQSRSNLDRVLNLRDKNPALVSADQVEKLRTEMDVNRSLLEAAEYNVEQSEAGLRNSRSVFSKATIYAPMSGRVTKLNIRQGETAIMGTLNRDAATLLTIADMSMLETKIKVDETEISRVKVGDSAVINIDAFGDTSFAGVVTEISNSSVTKSLTGTTTTSQAVDYEVTIRLVGVPENTRPDFTTQARIITAHRRDALSIPIIALTVREHEPVGNGDKPLTIGGDGSSNNVQKRDVEGVFIVDEKNTVTFRPVRIGIAGQDYFEVIGGLRRGELIVAGPYQAIRELKDGMKVKVSDKKTSNSTK